MFLLAWFLFLNAGLIAANYWAPQLLNQSPVTILMPARMSHEVAHLLQLGVPRWFITELLILGCPNAIGVVAWIAYVLAALVGTSTLRAALFPKKQRKEKFVPPPKAAVEVLKDMESQRLAGILNQMSAPEPPANENTVDVSAPVQS